MPRFRHVALLLLLLMLAACAPAAPTPPPDDLVQPKQVATVPLTPTPVGTLILPRTSTPRPTATITPIPPTATATPTVYTGIFMGDGSAPVVLPTLPPPEVVYVTEQVPGADAPTAAGAGVFPTATMPGAPTSALPTYSAPAIANPVAADGSCTLEPAPPFYGPYNTNDQVRAALGCPTGAGETQAMAVQPFERGLMIWRASGQIYALASAPLDGVSSLVWQLTDTWQEGMAQDDPSMTAPEGLIQPIRGFGLAWRTEGEVRRALGWATAGEEGYSGTWQPFQTGGMITTPGGAVYAIPTAGGQYIGPLF